jgi:hypothetical protein
LKIGVGIAVATTTRLVDGPAVCQTSAVFRLNVMRFTGDRSNIATPRLAAARPGRHPGASDRGGAVPPRRAWLASSAVSALSLSR